MSNIPLITLWELQAPGSNTIVRLTSSPPVRPEQSNFPNKIILIGGNRYYCIGISSSGIERTIGRVPTIKITVKLNEYMRARKDSLFVPGTRITRYQTDALAADVGNWPDGTNPYGAPARTNYRQDTWVITRVDEETQYELSASAQNEQAFWDDIVRPDIQGRCYHKYRGSDCGYTGTNYFDAQGKSVTKASDDVCGLRVKDCELRFPTGSLPYGGLPQ